ncbi:MAG: hypothetical protein ACQEUZ_01070 [Pseudomonadota bacterium]
MSRGAIQKAKAAGRLVLHADGSIDAAASDARRAAATDPSKSRPATAPAAAPQPAPAMKPVPQAAVSAVGETLKEQGLAAPPSGGGTTFLQAKTAHEVLKAQERRIRLARLKGELVDRDRATALVFRLAREERDAWVTWPARAAALMAADLEVETAAMQKVLEAHVRAHLDELVKRHGNGTPYRRAKGTPFGKFS